MCIQPGSGPAALSGRGLAGRHERVHKRQLPVANVSLQWQSTCVSMHASGRQRLLSHSSCTKTQCRGVAPNSAPRSTPPCNSDCKHAPCHTRFPSHPPLPMHPALPLRTVQRQRRNAPDQDAAIVITHGEAVGALAHPARARGLGWLVLTVQGDAQHPLCPAAGTSPTSMQSGCQHNPLCTAPAFPFSQQQPHKRAAQAVSTRRCTAPAPPCSQQQPHEHAAHAVGACQCTVTAPSCSQQQPHKHAAWLSARATKHIDGAA